MSVTWAVGILAALSASTGYLHRPAESVHKPTICGAGMPRDSVQVRVLPIGYDYRVFPSPKEIIERGGSASMVRAFWQREMAAICDQLLPAADLSKFQFLPRIVVFVDGEQDHDHILIEYPRPDDNPPAVRARVNGRMVAVPASVVRKLLDYSREGWRS